MASLLLKLSVFITLTDLHNSSILHNNFKGAKTTRISFLSRSADTSITKVEDYLCKKLLK